MALKAGRSKAAQTPKRPSHRAFNKLDQAIDQELELGPADTEAAVDPEAGPTATVAAAAPGTSSNEATTKTRLQQKLSGLARGLVEAKDAWLRSRANTPADERCAA